VEAAENSWRPLGELLLAKELITKDELDRALAEQADTGRLLGAILVERGFVSGPALAIALAEQHGVELNQERGFGTGLWAEIDKRHRAARGQGIDEEDEQQNVVRLEHLKPALEVVPELEPEPEPELEPEPEVNPELEELQAENQRLQAEIERLHGEFTRLAVVEEETPKVELAPVQPSSHLLFVPTAKRYLLVERDGPPPAPGEEVELPEVPGPLMVTKVGRSPYPDNGRPCAFLLPLS
jgi:hypothetical protein